MFSKTVWRYSVLPSVTAPSSAPPNRVRNFLSGFFSSFPKYPANPRPIPIRFITRNGSSMSSTLMAAPVPAATAGRDSPVSISNWEYTSAVFMKSIVPRAVAVAAIPARAGVPPNPLVKAAAASAGPNCAIKVGICSETEFNPQATAPFQSSISRTVRGPLSCSSSSFMSMPISMPLA